MGFSLRNDLATAASAVEASIEWLDPLDLAELIGLVEERFEQRSGLALWERISTGGERDPEGWRRVARMVAASSVILVGEESAGVFVGLAIDGRDLENLLGEASPFVMYATDRSASFVAAHNDHDFLIVEDPDGRLSPPGG